DGYLLTKGNNEPFVYASYGTQHPNNPGSTAIFNNTVNGLIVLRPMFPSGTFTLFAIDVSNLNNSGPAQVTFRGFRADGTVLQQSFNTNSGPNRLNTMNFPTNWTNLTRVEWTQVSPFHQFDNIVVSGNAR